MRITVKKTKICVCCVILAFKILIYVHQTAVFRVSQALNYTVLFIFYQKRLLKNTF